MQRHDPAQGGDHPAARPTKDEAVEDRGVQHGRRSRTARRIGYNTDYRAAMDSLEDALGGRGRATRTEPAARQAGPDPRGGGRGPVDRLRAGPARGERHDHQPARRARHRAGRGGRLPDRRAGRCGPARSPRSSSTAPRSACTPNVDDTPVPPAAFSKPEMVAFDTVYHPENTMFLKLARERGCTTVTGVDMFVRQAAAQFGSTPGEDAPMDLMRDVVRNASSGRSANERTTPPRPPGPGPGRLPRDRQVDRRPDPGRRLGRPFVDADVELEARVGRSIRSIFAEDGRARLPRLGGAGPRRADGGAPGRDPGDRRRGRAPRGEPARLCGVRLRRLAPGRPAVLADRLAADPRGLAGRPALTAGRDARRDRRRARGPRRRSTARWPTPSIETDGRTAGRGGRRRSSTLWPRPIARPADPTRRGDDADAAPGTMHAILIVGLFAIGTVVGSFLNVCIYRIPWQKSVIWPASHCPRCFSAIAAAGQRPDRELARAPGRLPRLRPADRGPLPAGRGAGRPALRRRLRLDVVYGRAIPWGPLPTSIPVGLAYHADPRGAAGRGDLHRLRPDDHPRRDHRHRMVVGLGLGTLFPEIRPEPVDARRRTGTGFWVGVIGPARRRRADQAGPAWSARSPCGARRWASAT